MKNRVEKSARTLSRLFPATRGPTMEASVPGGTLSWPIGLAHHLSALTGGRCSPRVGLASYVFAIGALLQHGTPMRPSSLVPLSCVKVTFILPHFETIKIIISYLVQVFVSTEIRFKDLINE